MAKKEEENELVGFVIDKTIRSGNIEVDEYISKMEEYILSFDTSHIKKLIVASDIVASQLAGDMVMIATNTHREKVSDDDSGVAVYKSKLNILSDDKDDKLLERLLNIVGKIPTFKQISDMVLAMKPKEKAEAEESVVKLDPTKNAYEQMMELKEKKKALKKG